MRRVDKPWGHEEIWAESEAYVGKILVIRAGHRLSLQHHEIKEETVRLQSGRMALELQNEAGDGGPRRNSRPGISYFSGPKASHDSH